MSGTCGVGGWGTVLKIKKYNDMILGIVLIYCWAFVTTFGRLDTEMKTQE